MNLLKIMMCLWSHHRVVIKDKSKGAVIYHLLVVENGEPISDQDLSERGKDKLHVVLNLHKVTVLQEMQDAAIRRSERIGLSAFDSWSDALQ